LQNWAVCPFNKIQIYVASIRQISILKNGNDMDMKERGHAEYEKALWLTQQAC